MSERKPEGKYLGLLLGAILLAGCGVPSAEDWVKAPREYQCSNEEMQKVEGETKSCVDLTDYSGQYCYGAAIIRNCHKPTPNEKDNGRRSRPVDPPVGPDGD